MSSIRETRSQTAEKRTRDMVANSLLNLSKQSKAPRLDPEPPNPLQTKPTTGVLATRPSNNVVHTQMFGKSVQDAFKIMDSVHDVFDRRGVKEQIAGMLKTNRNSKINIDIDEFCELVFDFGKKKVNTQQPSILGNKKMNNVSKKKFRSWVASYLQLENTEPKTLKHLKEVWKIKLFTLVSMYKFVLVYMNVSSKHLPYFEGSTDRILTKKVTASYIASYGILLASDAMKTSDALTTTQNMATLTLTNQAKKIGKFDVSNNYICNMAQVIDPANNIKLKKSYRFAFPMISEEKNTNANSNPNTRKFKLISTNDQIECKFNIVIEVSKNHDNKVIAELLNHVHSVSGDLLTTNFTTPSEFFKYVRVFVTAKTKNGSKQLENVNVHGLCVQTEFYKEADMYIPKHYVKTNNLAGFSVSDVIRFMKSDVQRVKSIETKKWIVRYYLDWKRMGDSFQITHLKDLANCNKVHYIHESKKMEKEYNLLQKSLGNNTPTLMKKRKEMDRKLAKIFHPYHFVSIDILAIVQCMMHGVNFIYEKDGNAYVVGNTVEFHNTYILKKLQQVMKDVNKYSKNERNKNNMHNATSILLNLNGFELNQ